MGDSLNDLKLTPSTLAGLYRNMLVDLHITPEAGGVKDESKTSRSSRRPSLGFIGGNARNVTILVRKKTGSLTEPEMMFLEKMLKACKLEQSDVAIVTISSNNVPMEEIVDRLKPAQILAFGTGSGNEFFTMENINGVKYLNAPSLDELMKETDTSRQFKSKLWTELKAMFGI
jgi:hypothetical protein